MSDFALPLVDANGTTRFIDNQIVTNANGETVLRQRTVLADRGLVGRLFDRNPADGYALWVDTADATYIYIAEAPAADTGVAATFRGLRVTKDASGNPLGKVQTATGFAWDSRSTTAWL